LIYEYKCKECGKVFERWSKQIRDSEWTEICPHDGGTGIRLISLINFQLKGRGWAKDGYSDPKNNTDNKPAASDSG
jgi:putative FmdB family regulatory protein